MLTPKRNEFRVYICLHAAFAHVILRLTECISNYSRHQTDIGMQENIIFA